MFPFVTYINKDYFETQLAYNTVAIVRICVTPNSKM